MPSWQYQDDYCRDDVHRRLGGGGHVERRPVRRQPRWRREAGVSINFARPSIGNERKIFSISSFENIRLI